MRGIHRSPVISPHKGQWRGVLMGIFICAWINGWVNNHKAGDLRRRRAHYGIIVMDMIRNKMRYHVSYLHKNLTWLATHSGQSWVDLAGSWRTMLCLWMLALTISWISIWTEPCSMISARKPTYMSCIHGLISVSRFVAPYHNLQTSVFITLSFPTAVSKLFCKYPHH